MQQRDADPLTADASPPTDRTAMGRARHLRDQLEPGRSPVTHRAWRRDHFSAVLNQRGGVFQAASDVLFVLSSDLSTAMTVDEAMARLADAGPELYSLHDPEGRYVYASRTSRNVTGWAARDLIGQSAYRFFHPDDVHVIERAHFENMGGGLKRSVRYRYRRPGGGYQWVETSTRSVPVGHDIALCVTRRIAPQPGAAIV